MRWPVAGFSRALASRVTCLSFIGQLWIAVADCSLRFTHHYGTEQLLISLAMGKVDACPFPSEEVAQFKRSVIEAAARHGYGLERRPGDRDDVPIDYRFLDLLLRIAKDPEVSIGEFSQGVRVGPGTRMPRLPALYNPKKKWHLASQADALDYLEHAPDHEGAWRRNYSTRQAFEQQILEVMHDQAARGQNIVLSEKEAKRTYPNLVIASLGVQRKEKPGGQVSARVMFDGTHELSVNTRIRLSGTKKGRRLLQTSNAR